MVQLILPPGASFVKAGGNFRHRPSSAPHRASPRLVGDVAPQQPSEQPQSPRSHRASPRLVHGARLSSRPASAPSTHTFGAPAQPPQVPQPPRTLATANYGGLVAKVALSGTERASVGKIIGTHSNRRIMMAHRLSHRASRCAYGDREDRESQGYHWHHMYTPHAPLGT